VQLINFRLHPLDHNHEDCYETIIGAAAAMPKSKPYKSGTANSTDWQQSPSKRRFFIITAYATKSKFRTAVKPQDIDFGRAF